MTKIELYVLPFQFVDTDKQVTKSMDESFQQCVGTDNDGRSQYDLCLTAFEVMQTTHPFTLASLSACRVG